MRLECYPNDKLKKEIKAIISKYLDLKKYKLFFFGSRVINKGTDRSDVDVGIEGKAPIPPAKLLSIEEEIEELPTLYKIEIVDFRYVDPKFKKVALQNIELIA